MNFKKLSLSLVLAAAGIMAANAGSIDVNAARQAANSFLKSKMTAQGMLKAPAMADIKLAHTEASSVEGNAYYVFNIQGGGWPRQAGARLWRQGQYRHEQHARQHEGLPATVQEPD